MNQKPLLELQSLTKKFHNEPVLNDISLKIAPLEIVCILGHSGCGKSTLLRSINLLEIPNNGVIRLNDKIAFDGAFDSNKDSHHFTKHRKNIGMVFQHCNLFPHMNVIDNITFAPIVGKLKTKTQARQEAMTLLDKVGLSQFSKKMPRQLSGGQKQRVAIIRALLMDSQIILFDEPTSALDPAMVEEVLSLIANLGQKVTMILVTHEFKFAKNIASRIIFMDNGFIIEDSSAKEFFSKPKSKQAQEFLQKCGL